MAGIVKEIMSYQRPFKTPCALISGGETTVTIKGKSGQGGPNQEFALGFISKMKSRSEFACVSIDSDGTDGPTSIAGGVVDDHTWEEAEKKDLDINEYLKNHNSSEILQHLGSAIITGHTGTNLQNLRVVLIR